MSRVPARDSCSSKDWSVNNDAELILEIYDANSDDLAKIVMAATDKIASIFDAKVEALDLRLEELDRKALFLNNSVNGRISNGNETANGQNHRAKGIGGPPKHQRNAEE